jgi:hypothetical protein
MKNQSRGSGGRSDKVQPMKKDSASKTVSGKGPAAGTSKGKSTVAASAAGQSGVAGAMDADGAKGGHV